MAFHSLLAVFAHPDDETIVSPLLARYAHQGHQVHLLILTAGERGYREHVGIPMGEPLAAVRARELACAAEALGLSGFTLLRFPDQGFSSGYNTQIWIDAVSEVRQAVDRIRPDVLLTWGPEGGTGHPDHRAVNSIVAQAFQHRALLKHYPRKLYYAVFPETDDPCAEDWASGTRISREFVTTAVDCADYLPASKAALECYVSQWSPEMMSRVRGLCDAEHGRVFLRLAYSTAAPVPSPENCIFAGL